MVGAGDNFQIGKQCAAIQRGGDLTDAAANLIHQIVAGICRGGLVALCGGAFAQSVVEGEGLAGVQHDAVQRLTCQLQIRGAVGVVTVGRAGGAQNIPEEHVVVQNFRGDIFHGNADDLAVLRRTDLLLRLHHVEHVAVGAGDGLEGLHIDGGVHGLYADIVVNFLQINGIRFALGLRALRLYGENVHAVGVQNLVEHIIYVEIYAGSSHCDDQRQLRGVFFVKFVRRKIGDVAFQRIGGLGQQTAGGSGVVLQNALDIILLQMQVGQQPDDVVAPEGRLIGFLTLGLGAGSAVGIGGVDGGLCVQLRAGIAGGQL